MSENQEAITDIVEEMRNMGNYQSYSGDHAKRLANRIEAATKREKSQSWHQREMEELVLRHEKEVIELKKQIGNAAAMREALKNLTRFEESDIRQLETLAQRAIDNDIYGGGILQAITEAIRKGKEALSKPPRNCDVGTAEEQLRRYNNFTGRYNPCSYRGYARCTEDCPVRKKLIQEGYGELLCQLEWAQMPYESEVADDN